MNTVLITGSSSGIGKDTALHFQKQGWQVAASMRTPEKAADLAALPNVLVPRLDVTDEASIAQAIEATLARFGAIDVLINNAGYAVHGPFEASSDAQIRRQFDTNVFGLMAVTRAMLPHFRARRRGTIINVSSMGGRLTFPLYSVYHATKWAVEGFSESLQQELRPLNIRVKLIEPGAIKTDFYDRSMDVAPTDGLPDYADYVAKVMPRMQVGDSGAPPADVARIIFRAATSRSWKLRYPAGGNADLLLGLRYLLPDAAYFGLIRSQLEK